MRRLAIFIAKIIGYLFYDKKYLQGKWFEKNPNGDGWIFVLKCFLWQKIFRINGKVPYPVNQNIRISNYKKLHFHLDDLNNFQGFGVYFQNFLADIYIGRGTYIAPNVGLITANHDPKNPDFHLNGENIVIGEKCWIGMNAVILPGVKLGDNTVVAAGAVVTKSFEEGNCIVGGVPAKLIKKIED